jgi:cytochrome c554/c'-like protein
MMRSKTVVPLALMCIAASMGPVELFGGQMATADRVQNPGWWPTKPTALRKDFVGADACAPCHPAQSTTQPTTAMARTAMRAHDSSVLRDHNRLATTLGAYSYEIVTDEQGSLYAVTSGSARSSAALTWAFGVGKVGQSFLFERDGAFHEARVSYYDAIGALDVTPGRRLDAPRGLDEAMSRRVSAAEMRRCFGCHTTGPITEGVLDTAAATPGIACEACHGPGRQHVESMKQRHMAEGRQAILNPAKLAPADSVDFCGACHATFWDVTLANEKGAAAMRSQPFRLSSSRCWNPEDVRITCTACHNPHRPLVRDAAAYDSRCLACHAAAGAEPARDHPGRACKVSRSNCAGCHMPKYDVPDLHHSSTDHLIRIVLKTDGMN